MIRPQTDDYPEELERVVIALVSGDRDRAAKALEPIAYPRREIAERSEPSETVIASAPTNQVANCAAGPVETTT